MTSRPAPMPQRRRRAGLLVAALTAAGVLQILGANPAVSQSTTLAAPRTTELPGLDPADAMWDRAPQIEVPLTAQATTYPFGGGAVPAVRVRAMHDGETLLIRVAWDDDTGDDRAVRPEEFADALAVELPASAGSTVPAICMGQAAGGVNIWQWRADSERDLPASADELHERGYVDLYPSTDDLYFPAREAGNPYALADAGPVQDLVATGFGTLEPAGDQSVAGRGARDGNGWAVVFSRPFAADDDSRPDFEVGTTTDMALAAWDGAHRDRNGQKSVSAFVQLSVSDEPLPPRQRTTGEILGVSAAIIGGLVALSLGFTYLTGRPRRTET